MNSHYQKIILISIKTLPVLFFDWIKIIYIQVYKIFYTLKTIKRKKVLALLVENSNHFLSIGVEYFKSREKRVRY